MHEYSLVLSLLGRVQAEVTARGAKAVHRVRVQLGELSGVEPTLFASAFELAREGTPCQAAALDIDVVAARWVCSRCERVILSRSELRCAQCDVAARLVSGGEIVFDSMELEI